MKHETTCSLRWKKWSLWRSSKRLTTRTSRRTCWTVSWRRLGGLCGGWWSIFVLFGKFFMCQVPRKTWCQFENPFFCSEASTNCNKWRLWRLPNAIWSRSLHPWKSALVMPGCFCRWPMLGPRLEGLMILTLSYNNIRAAANRSPHFEPSHFFRSEEFFGISVCKKNSSIFRNSSLNKIQTELPVENFQASSIQNSLAAKRWRESCWSGGPEVGLGCPHKKRPNLWPWTYWFYRLGDFEVVWLKITLAPPKGSFSTIFASGWVGFGCFGTPRIGTRLVRLSRAFFQIPLSTSWRWSTYRTTVSLCCPMTSHALLGRRSQFSYHPQIQGHSVEIDPNSKFWSSWLHGNPYRIWLSFLST